MHQPHVVSFQEMTREMWTLLNLSSIYPHCTQSPSYGGARYWTMIASRYPLSHCVRIPFQGSTQGRDVLSACVSVSSDAGSCIVFVSTSHLESLGSGSLEREAQLNFALSLMYDPQVSSLCPVARLFGGDLNLKPVFDGQVEPSSEWWIDAWCTSGICKQCSECDCLCGGGATRNSDRLDRIFIGAKDQSVVVKETTVEGNSRRMSALMGKEISGSDHKAVLVTMAISLSELLISGNSLDSPPAVKFNRPENWMRYI